MSRRRGRQMSIQDSIWWWSSPTPTPWPASPSFSSSLSSLLSTHSSKWFLIPSTTSKFIVQILIIVFIMAYANAEPVPIMTLPNDGSVYSLFPDEDLRTGRKFFRFEDDPLSSRNRNLNNNNNNPARPHLYSSSVTASATSQDRNRNPALFRERQSGDRYRFRGEASYVQPNTSPPNANYIVRPLDNGNQRAISFNDDRIRGGVPNYLSAYRNRDLPFDRPNPLYLPPRHHHGTSTPATIIPARRPMELDIPTIHIYDPASQSFIPKGTTTLGAGVGVGGAGIEQPLPGPVIPPDPRIKVKPGRLLIPGLHNSLSSEEAGPETFLNHEDYLDYHTNIELERLAELDRKMKAMQAQVLLRRKGNNNNNNLNNDAEVVLFKGGSESSGGATSTSAEEEDQEEDGDGSAEGESGYGGGRGGEEKQQPSQIHGEKSKVIPIPITKAVVTPAVRQNAIIVNAARFPLQSRNKETPASSSSSSSSSSPPSTRAPEVQDRFSPLITLPKHLRDEASPSRLLQIQKLKTQQQRFEHQELQPKVDTGITSITASPTFRPTQRPTASSAGASVAGAKAVKSGLGTETQSSRKTIPQNQNQQHGIKKLQLQQLRDDDVPSSSLHPPPAPIAIINANPNPLLQQKKTYHQQQQQRPSHVDEINERHIEIIPSIITQSSSTRSGGGGPNEGLIDGHFDIVPGVPETIGFGRHSSSGSGAGGRQGFRNSDIADDFDENDNVARFRHTDTNSRTPFLLLETKQVTKAKAEIQSAHSHTDMTPPQETQDENRNKSNNSSNGNGSRRSQKKQMILVKRIKHLDSHHKNSNSTASSSRSSNGSSSSKKAQSDYESTMTVHKIQESSAEKLDDGIGIFSSERVNDFNLQSQTKSTSSKGVVSKIHAHVSSCPKLDGPTEIICDVHIRKRHGNVNPHLTVGWKRKFYNASQPDIIVAVNKTLAYHEEEFHDKFNVTLAPGINPMLRSVLLIKHVTPPDTGNYQCEVTDGENHLKSETLLFLCH